jgi:hypothetical protein
MKCLIKKFFAGIVFSLLCVVLFTTPTLAGDSGDIPDDISAHAMAWDAFLVRPLGVVSIGVGSVIFGITSPLAALGGNIHATFEKLIAEPVAFTFQRPLGDF